MLTSSRRLGAAGLTGCVAVVTLGAGPAWAVDPSQPTLDRDGDRRADLGVLRYDPATDDMSWIWSSGQRDVWGVWIEDSADSDAPVYGDFDGDGRNDATVYRPGTPSIWFVKGTTSGQRALQFGDAARGDTPVRGDFDGDGKADLAVVRPTSGGGPLTWYVVRSSGGQAVHTFGDSSDTPVPANYVGGRASDVAVRRIEDDGTSAVYVLTPTGRTERIAWGRSFDEVVKGDYDGDGRTDIAVVRRVQTPDGREVLRWFIRLSGGGQAVLDHGDAETDDPVPADYTGDGRTDVGVVRYAENLPGEVNTTPLAWFIRSSADGTTTRRVFGESRDLAVSNS